MFVKQSQTMNKKEAYHFDLLMPLLSIFYLNEFESKQLLIDLKQALCHGFHWEVLLQDFLHLQISMFKNRFPSKKRLRLLMSMAWASAGFFPGEGKKFSRVLRTYFLPKPTKHTILAGQGGQEPP
jgi:hypothetical protein